MQIRLTLFVIFSCWFSLLNAQFFDDFSDDNLWSRYQGDVANFIVNVSQQLQLSAPVAGSSYLSRQIELKDSMVWEFYTRLDFDPSASNRLRFWLFSTSVVLEQGDGIYLEVGESLNNDALRLFEKSGSTRTELAHATLGKMALAPAVAAVRCVYNSDGNFVLSADYSGSDLYAVEFSVPFDFSRYTDPGFFGIFCQYTDTRRSHFYFDNIRFDELKPDTMPPVLLSFEYTDSITILLKFNEDIDPQSLSDDGTVFLQPSQGLLEVLLNETNPRQINITLSIPLNNTVNYEMRISQLADLSGNIMGDTVVIFQYLVFENPDPYDLIFSELMVRPNPPQGLPNAEYIELYNRSNKVLRLGDFSILDGTVFRQIDNHALLPGEFAILCSRANMELFQSYGKTIGMASFPGLTDSGKRLGLYYQMQQMIDWVEYDDTWYGVSFKSNGGFSLELINPQGPCLLRPNWSGTDSNLGGTPGRINSIWKPETDTSRFEMVNVYPESDQRLTLYFDKKMDPASAVELNNYFINGPDIEEVHWNNLNPTELSIILSEQMKEGEQYDIDPALLRDCQRILGADNNLSRFGQPEKPTSQDVVINEILFQPETGGSRFVELYNKSDKLIDLTELFIADFSGSSGAGSRLNLKYLLFPDSYVALSANPEYIRSRYNPPPETKIFKYTLPTLSDRAGNVSLYYFNDNDRIIIDSVNYSRDFHYGLLSDRRGISIERISPDRASSDANNWHSAAQHVGYGTPGYKNSQFRANPSVKDSRIFIPDPFFTPNDDGYRDFLEIAYNTGRPGFASNVRIFDAQGRLVRVISKQEILSESGVFIWDGISDNGQRLNMGIYVVIVELVHPDGEIIRFKSDCTLGGSF